MRFSLLPIILASASYPHPIICASDPDSHNPFTPYYQTNCASTPLTHYFPLIIQSLQPILHALNSTPPHPALLAFFKNPAHAPFLHRTFHAIATGALLPSTNLTPSVDCTAPGRSVYDLFCFASHEQGGGPVAGTALPYHSLVALCPGAFTFPAFPSRASCPRVVSVHHRGGTGGSRQEFVDDGMNFTQTLFGVLLHELVHLYNPLDDGVEGEVYTVKGCAELGRKKSLGNAANWVYFASGEFLFLFFLGEEVGLAFWRICMKELQEKGFRDSSCVLTASNLCNSRSSRVHRVPCPGDGYDGTDQG
ncbi:MAG: hypothetical protein LQ345_002099 [Seirophora villosa]|nr:MAG: hypothetical protein LQ345_002099 [Seirophora villosa]